MYWSAALVGLVPLGVVTVTSTVPAVPAGAVAVIWVALLTATLVAAVEPKATPVAPVKLVPVIVTEVPPAVGPEDGLTCVTAGAGGSTVAVPCAVAPGPADVTDRDGRGVTAGARVRVGPGDDESATLAAATVPVEPECRRPR